MEELKITASEAKKPGCECMENFERSIVERQPFTDLKVTDASFDKTMVYAANTLISRPVLEIEVTAEGRKRPVRKSILYNFCPFCGNRYEPLPKEEVTNG